MTNALLRPRHHQTVRGRLAAGLDIEKLKRVRAGELSAVDAAVALLGEPDFAPVEADDADELLGRLGDELAADIARERRPARLPMIFPA